MKHDPIEDDPEYQSIFATIDDEVEALLAEEGYTLKIVGMGFCLIEVLSPRERI